MHRGRPLGRTRRASPRHLHRQRARRRAARGRPGAANRSARQQQVRRGDRRALEAGSAGSSSTRSPRSTGWPMPRARSVGGPPVMLRVTAGVEAHTHSYIATAHEDQKFGLSLDRRRGRPRRSRECWPGPSSSCGAALAHRVADPRRLGVRGGGAPAAEPARRACSASTGSRCPSSTSAAASASRTRRSTTRCRSTSWPLGWPTSSPRSARIAGVPRAADLDRAGPGHRRALDLHAVHRRHGQGRRARRRASRAATWRSTAG